jgi:hypothetical protein
MPSLRKQFTIDNDLGRHSRALSRLYELDDFNEVKRYIGQHELYAAAIDLYKYQPQRLDELMRLNGDFLNSRNRFKEAGIGKFQCMVLVPGTKLTLHLKLTSILMTTLPHIQHIALPICGERLSLVDVFYLFRQMSLPPLLEILPKA